MQGKIIKSILRKKVNNFLESINNPDLVEELKKDIIITGGSIVSLLLNEPVNDFDIYFRTKETALKVATYYVKEAKEKWKTDDIFINETEERIKIIIPNKGCMGNVKKEKEDTGDIEKSKNPEYRIRFISSNAITLSDKIQLILRFYGEPKDIHSNYDFIHCTCYWTYYEGELVLPSRALEAIINKELYYQGSKYPLCSIFRTRKFLQKGWNINAGQYLKMALQLNKLDLSNVAVLEDQLIGVDTLYFMYLINIINEKKENEPDFVIDNSYIIEIVNRIF